jgi:outer membrane murein-binding lipoprotein Lpp
MSEATEKNFQIVQNVLNEQAGAIRNLQQKITQLEGNVARLQAEIIATKQMNAHLAGRGMGSTVHN